MAIPVVGYVGVWWSKHSTPNPLGTKPACPIVDLDKFVVARPKFKFPTSPTVIAYQERMEKWKKENEEKKEEKK